jgi:tetratricopeptide (TPR) repeat protein
MNTKQQRITECEENIQELEEFIEYQHEDKLNIWKADYVEEYLSSEKTELNHWRNELAIAKAMLEVSDYEEALEEFQKIASHTEGQNVTSWKSPIGHEFIIWIDKNDEYPEHDNELIHTTIDTQDETFDGMYQFSMTLPYEIVVAQSDAKTFLDTQMDNRRELHRITDYEDDGASIKFYVDKVVFKGDIHLTLNPDGTHRIKGIFCVSTDANKSFRFSELHKLAAGIALQWQAQNEMAKV